MQLHNEIQTQRNAAMEGFMAKRLQVKQAEEAKMEKQFDTIMEAARDCGVTEDNAQLWILTFSCAPFRMEGRLLLSTTLGSSTRPFYLCIVF
jgi:hypothetical protein